MPEHFHLVLEGGDAAYWQILRAMREAGFEVVLDFEPEDPLLWRMTIRPGYSPDASARETIPVVEMPVPARDPLADERIATGIDFTVQEVYGLNLATLKMILRERPTSRMNMQEFLRKMGLPPRRKCATIVFMKKNSKNGNPDGRRGNRKNNGDQTRNFSRQFLSALLIL